jgi:hypothetical protein
VGEELVAFLPCAEVIFRSDDIFWAGWIVDFEVNSLRKKVNDVQKEIAVKKKVSPFLSSSSQTQRRSLSRRNNPPTTSSRRRRN